MNKSEAVHSSYLRRLDPGCYRGTAFVHWTLTIRDRRRGWLDSSFHAAFRECLIHHCFRHHLWVPVYCLMPDHLHLLVLGDRSSSDQLRAMRWFRKQINWLLRQKGCVLQSQGYDHVLRDRERDRFAFERTADYILKNPVRAQLVAESENWPWMGAILPGFPEIDFAQRGTAYWDDFWRVYSKSVGRNAFQEDLL